MTNSQPTSNPSQIRSSDITPPPELVQQWGHDANLSGVPHNDEHWAYEQHIATRAAHWGADQELEACCEWVEDYAECGHSLRLARRPKPPSLKEQALESVKRFEKSGEFFSDQMRELEFIRKALETIND
jgi:hypothetical protein